MKLSLTERETAYLALHMKLLTQMSRRADLESGLYRVAKKLSNRLTPNVKELFVNGKDREVITSAISIRQRELLKEGGTSPEIDLIQSIIEKVEK